MASILAVPGLEATSSAFKRALLDVAAELGLNADFLAAVISFETGETFSPSVRSGGDPTAAVGLIQFANSGGYSNAQKDAFARMSADAQMRGPVAAHYRKVLNGRKITSLADHYMVVLASGSVGKPPGAPLFVSPANTYEKNRSLDADGDGTITVGEATARVQAKLNAAQGQRIEVRAAAGNVLAAALVLGLAAMVALRLKGTA